MKKTTFGSILAMTLVAAFGFFMIQSALAHDENRGKSGIKGRLNDLRKELRLDRFDNRIIIGEKMFKAEAVSVTGNILKARIKGVEVTVNTDANDVIVNRVWDKIVLANIQPGDELRIVGDLSGTTIEAKLVRDLSIPPVLEKNLTGKITLINGNTFKLMVGGKEFTVNVDANDVVVNRIWDKIALADIKVGDKVMVFGAVTDLSVQAKLVRDLSLPQLQIQALNDLELEIEND